VPLSHNASIAKGFRVLEAFKRGHAALTLTQLVEITGLEKSAVQRLTATLVELGYLRKDPVRKHYEVAPRLLHLGTSYLRTNPLIERARPYLLEWSRDHNETINFGELQGTQVIITYRFRTRQFVRTDFALGSSYPWHISSIGQTIVAFMPEEKRNEILDKSELIPYTNYTITDKSKLLNKLDQITRDGFVLCEKESYEEDLAIAAPIFDSKGSIAASVSTAVLLTQWTSQEARENLVYSVRLLAKAITGSMSLPGVSANDRALI
jgi:DNA-binding IclR family transcriptional regulator